MKITTPTATFTFCNDDSPPLPSKTPLTDAAVTDFEYGYTGYGGESLTGSKDIIEPDFCRKLETVLHEMAKALMNIYENGGSSFAPAVTMRRINDVADAALRKYEALLPEEEEK